MDQRDSLGVCLDSEGEAESLQRDRAVCISTNGTWNYLSMTVVHWGPQCSQILHVTVESKIKTYDI